MNTENNPNPMNLDELFASPATTVPEPSPAVEPQFSPVSEPAAPKPDNIVDLFGAVVEQSEEDSLTELMAKIAQSRPVFDYASIQDEIKDADMTFEQLRVKMSADCPELEARAHVSWSLSYAGFSERITDVNSTIYDAKSKMEQSKKFKDALKSASLRINCRFAASSLPSPRRRREFFLSLHTRQSAKAWMRQIKQTYLSAIFLRRTGRFTKCAATRSVRLSRRPRKSWSWTWYGQGFR